jgi:hypothetical protein
MNIIARPPVDPRSRGRSGDDLDGLLREFFQAEMPHPWPAFQPPVRLAVPPARPVRPWGNRFRTALALAASIAILALGLGLLSGKFEPGSGPMPVHSDAVGHKPPSMTESLVVGPDGQTGFKVEQPQLPGDEDY